MWLLKYNGFLSYNGFINFLIFFTGFRHFWGLNWRCADNNGVPVRVASYWRHESQSGGRPNEDMTMSYAPSFRASGGHIFDVVAQILKKHVFTAQNSQHVASELLMRWRSQTDRNTPSEWKIDWGKSGYN